MPRKTGGWKSEPKGRKAGKAADRRAGKRKSAAGAKAAATKSKTATKSKAVAKSKQAKKKSPVAGTPKLGDSGLSVDPNSPILVVRRNDGTVYYIPLDTPGLKSFPSDAEFDIAIEEQIRINNNSPLIGCNFAMVGQEEPVIRIAARK